MKKSSRTLGISIFILGLVFVGINWYTITYEFFFLPKLLGVGIVCSFIGFGFLLFPGGDADIKNRKTFFKDKWKNSVVLDRLMWILFMIGGIVTTVWAYVYLDL